MNREEKILRKVDVANQPKKKGSYWCEIDTPTGKENRECWWYPDEERWVLDSTIPYTYRVLFYYEELTLGELIEKQPKLSLDLVALSKKVDELLEKETPESFQNWLKEYREKYPDHFIEENSKLAITPTSEVDKELLEKAKEIIQMLKAFGMIHTVTGVVYPEGSHNDFIKKAHEWLEEYQRLIAGKK